MKKVGLRFILVFSLLLVFVFSFHLGPGQLLHTGRQVVGLQLELGFLLLQLLFGSLKGVHLLTELCHCLRVFLSQSCRCGLVVKCRVLEFPP